MARAAAKAPGKAHREGITRIALLDMFQDEQAATRWFEAQVWRDGRHCGHCGSQRTSAVPKARRMPWWYCTRRSCFSVRTGTALERSRVPLRKRAIAIYLAITSLKSVSSMKLHRDIGASQPTAWFMLHRICEGWTRSAASAPFAGPAEVDEIYSGGKRKNMSNAKRKALTECGPVGHTAVAGIKVRATNQVAAQVVTSTDEETLQGFVIKHAAVRATVCSDEAAACQGLSRMHEAVKPSVKECVRMQAHTNGVDSFWAMLKRAREGMFHKIRPKHGNRCVQEFAGKHNVRDLGTLAQMTVLVAGLVGKRLMYRDLIAGNGLASGSRS